MLRWYHHDDVMLGFSCDIWSQHGGGGEGGCCVYVCVCDYFSSIISERAVKRALTGVMRSWTKNFVL